jgi:glycosyltransferase involved in cell wall biosynthesis
MPKVSIIIPAKDEEVTLPAVLADINKVTPTLNGWEVEIIVVDDRSTDRTRNWPRLRAPRLSGTGANQARGMRSAQDSRTPTATSSR